MSNDKYSLYDPNDVVQAVVCDIGSYATKIGFAGDDFPKSYFRSVSNLLLYLLNYFSWNIVVNDNKAHLMNHALFQNVAILRDPVTKKNIQQLKYDYFTRPIEYPKDSDGNWETANPIDPHTGLLATDDLYELFQQFLQHAFKTTLLTAPSEQPFLFCERSYNPPPMRQQLLEILMEDIQVPAAFLARDATLACYACGRTTGTVVDVGYHGTTVTPVYEGYVELKGIRLSPIGTKEMDTTLMGQLDRIHTTPFLPLYQLRNHAIRRDDIHFLTRLAVAQECREEGAGTAIPSPVDATFQAPHATFQLPDGTVLDLPAKVRFSISDLLLGQDEVSVQVRQSKMIQRKQALAAGLAALMDDDDTEHDKGRYSEASAVGLTHRKLHPTAVRTRPPFSNRHLQRACAPYLSNVPLEGLSDANLPSMICEAAFSCDRDQQASLLGNVVLAGGGACVGPTDQALPEFLREKMEEIIHKHTPGWRVKVLSPNYPERKVCSWMGGSILGSLGSFHDMYITKKEYEEWGSAIVNRKCP